MLLRIEPLGGPTPPEAPRSAQRRAEGVGTIPVIPPLLRGAKQPACRRPVPQIPVRVTRSGLHVTIAPQVTLALMKARAMSTDDFFNDVKRPQSALKHAILRDYLATFAGATGTRSAGNRVGFLDGYAGPGEYVDPVNGARRDGSPKIALTIADNQRQLPRNLECVFVEQKLKHYKQLQELCVSASTKATPFYGDVREHLGAALKLVEGIPLLMFLDPFGAAMDSDAVTDAVLTRPDEQPTEILLNFSVETIRRAGPRVRETGDSHHRLKTIARMDSWLGGDWWQEHFLSPEFPGHPEAADVAATRVANEFARRIRDATGAGSFPVPMRRSATKKPIFILYLFFQRSLAAFKYNESVSRAQEKWRETMWGIDLAAAERLDETEPRLGTSYADEMRDLAKMDKIQFQDDVVSTIKDSIRSALATQPRLSVEKDFAKIFGAAIGQGHTPHLRRAWKELAVEGVTNPTPTGKLDKAVISRPLHVVGPTF